MGLFSRKTSKEEDNAVLKASDTKEKVKWSKRPANSSFRQQRLKAWQPILTPATVLPTFLLVGILFVPLGGVLLYGSNQVKEFTIDYTSCEFVAPNTSFASLSPDLYTYHTGSSSPVAAPSWSFTHDAAPGANASTRSLCRLQFQLPGDMKAPVFMYYKLTNYYQNHRRYVKSIDTNQLKGSASTASSLSNGNCKPVAVAPNGLPIFPCGLIANSVFNDTFLPPVLVNPAGGSSNVTYNMTSKGIAWPGEAQKYGVSSYNSSSCSPPPYWALRYPDGYTPTGPTAIPDLSLDEHFQVWMRTAGLPTFRKLYFRNDEEVMRAGQYELDIYMNYPVAPFGGTKSVVFSTVSFIGGRNPFLGIAYIAIGGACILLGLGLTARHLIRPRKLGDMSYLSWNNDKKEK